MKKYILGVIFSLCLLISPAFAPPAEAASLTSVQVSAIVSLLQVLGVDQSILNNIQTALSGGTTVATPLPVVIASTNLSGLQITSENLPAFDSRATSNHGVNSYTTTLTYTGGTGTPVWSLVQEVGMLPSDLDLNKDTGVISSNPAVIIRSSSAGVYAGIYYFTVKLTVGSDVVTKRLSITMIPIVVASASQIKILTTTLPAAVVGKPYYATIAVNPEAGVSDNIWSATGINYINYQYINYQKIPGFPEGLMIDAKTGVISGIPVRIGTTSFIVSVGHKPSQNDGGSTDYMYYTIPVASSPDVTKLVSIKEVEVGNDIGHVNGSRVTDIYRLVTTANFSDGSLVGQKIIWRQIGEMHNRIQGFDTSYCVQKVSPWSDVGTVPGITVKDLASKSFSATKVHTYGIEYQINPAGVYEFAAVATAADGSTFTAAPHLFTMNGVGSGGGDLSQADAIAQGNGFKSNRDLNTCTYNGQSYSGMVNNSSLVRVHTFGEEVQNGWGQDGVVISTTPVSPPTSSNLVVSVSNSVSGPFVTNGTVLNNLPFYTRIVSANVNMKSYSPKGCAQPAGTSGCLSDLGYRDFLPSEWLDNSTIQTVVQNPWVYPLNTFEAYIKFPGGSPIKVGTFRLIAPSAVTLSTVHLTSLSPSTGKAGTTVTINGSGFTGTNTIYLKGIPVDTLSTSGGLTPTWISFVIPSNLPSCPDYDRLCVPGPALTTGTYAVSVQNTNGTSNAVSFVVSPPTTIQTTYQWSCGTVIGPTYINFTAYACNSSTVGTTQNLPGNPGPTYSCLCTVN